MCRLAPPQRRSSGAPRASLQARALLLLGVVAICLLSLAPRSVLAAGIVATGDAKVSEWKSGGTLAKARARAIRRARTTALSTAIDGVEGKTDAALIKAITRAGEGWTGAYRILDERVDGGAVQVKLEVDIDTARLAKRVSAVEAGDAPAPRFAVGEVHGAAGCELFGDAFALELESLGLPAAVDAPKARSIEVTVRCHELGAVPNTLLRAVRLETTARAGKEVLSQTRVAGFGVDDASARAQAVGRAADALAVVVQSSTRPGVELRVESPHPASRVRRLHRAIEQSVRGVRAVRLAAVDADGAVRLRVVGRIDASALARALETLSLPDFSLTIVRTDAPNSLTIRLR